VSVNKATGTLFHTSDDELGGQKTSNAMTCRTKTILADRKAAPSLPRTIVASRKSSCRPQIQPHQPHRSGDGSRRANQAARSSNHLVPSDPNSNGRGCNVHRPKAKRRFNRWTGELDSRKFLGLVQGIRGVCHHPWGLGERMERIRGGHIQRHQCQARYSFGWTNPLVLFLLFPHASSLPSHGMAIPFDQSRHANSFWYRARLQSAKCASHTHPGISRPNFSLSRTPAYRLGAYS
jgi:hypothetical protein